MFALGTTECVYFEPRNKMDVCLVGLKLFPVTGS